MVRSIKNPARVSRIDLIHGQKHNQSKLCGSNERFPMRTLTLFRLIVLLILFWAPSQWLWAENYEVGVTYAVGSRVPNRFSKGIDRFRTTLSPYILNAVDGDSFRRMDSAEAWFRTDAIAENHYLGFSAGGFIIPRLHTREYRSDGTVTDLNWDFDLPYFLITYHYIDSLRFWRMDAGWSWEAGAAFGFIPASVWKVKGYSAGFPQFQLAEYNIRQQGRTGNIARVELGVRRWLWDGLFFRFGLRGTYEYVGYWEDTSSNGGGLLYYHLNGGLVPLTTFNVLAAQNILLDRQLGLTQAALLRRRADMGSTVGEVQLSIGFRF
ncbi:MAG: hypothetical protein KDK30_09055 [Leptospiraceae bacterium]|nr:hypothetical protein [Leptospiraceae bacterium]